MGPDSGKARPRRAMLITFSQYPGFDPPAATAGTSAAAKASSGVASERQ
jgi:hypothetical protein